MLLYTGNADDVVRVRQWDELVQDYVDVVIVGYRTLRGAS